MDELEEYKELYYKEIEYTERLNSKINMCMTFLTIIGSGVILVWSQLGKASPSIYFSNCTDIDINVNNCQCCEGGEKNGK